MVGPAARDASHKYLAFQQFKTLNSQPSRTALEQDEFAWIENLMPIGDANAPAVPAPGAPLALFDGTARTLVEATPALQTWTGKSSTIVTTLTIDGGTASQAWQGKTAEVIPATELFISAGAGSQAWAGKASTVSVDLGVVTLLLNHFNGSDGATTFTDEVAGISWSRRSAVGELDTSEKKFGSASLYVPTAGFTGIYDGQGFSSPHAGNFSIEAFVRFSSGSDQGLIEIAGNNGSEDYPVEFLVYRSLQAVSFAVQSSPGTYIFNDSLSVTVADDTWYHCAVVRNVAAGTYEAFFNGNRVFSKSSGTNAISFDRLTLIASAGTPNPAYRIDEARVTDGVVYSGATYTPPAAEFTT